MGLFTKDHGEFRARVRTFVESHLLPNASVWERDRGFPRSVFRDLGEAGFLGLTQDRKFGGQGLDFSYSVAFVEELPRSQMMGLTLSVIAQTNIFPPALSWLGTEDQKRNFLGPAVRGELIGGFAATEPTGGSDLLGAVHTVAVDDGDFWVVTGEKKYITNGPIADALVVLVRTRPERSLQSLSLLIVPTDIPGFRVKESLEKLGMHSSPTGWLEFDHCRVPKALTLGKPHMGYHYFARNILEERLLGGAAAVAAADLALQDTIRYVQRREAFGQPLSKLQALRHRIAEMSAELEMCRRFVHSVCESYRDGRVEAKEICMIKFRVFEAVQRLTEQCLQLQGGYGFLAENWITRMYRDVRVLSVGGGASELMKDLVAAYLRL
jgi:citronellyl-CoA dehydrogenase